ncbi:MAG: T9SS type A sorting domain-containing protein [Bacteroidetes bacterium]|nr:T9SS type A sorting domain-containing protein [Bacteroidota bacterium]
MTDADGLKSFTVKPVHQFGTSSGFYLIDTHWHSGSSVTLWRIDNPSSNPTLTQQATIQVGGYYEPPDAKQEGTTNLISVTSVGTRTQDAVYRNGYLYTAFTTQHDWGSGNVSAIQYEKIDVSSNIAVIDAVYGADYYYYFDPNIYVDAYGDIVLAFGESSGSQYAGVWWSYRTPTDGSMRSSQVLRGGDNYYNGSRWGDYSGICLDGKIDSQIWLCGEYATTNTSNWGTWIGSFRFAPVQFTNSVNGSDGGGTLEINSTLVVSSRSSVGFEPNSNNTELTLAQGGSNQDRFTNVNSVPLAKHNNWDAVNSSYLLNNSFTVNGTPGETETAYFLPLNPVTLTASSIDGANISSLQLQLNDPWYFNSNGSQGNNFTQAAIPITQTSSPMTGAYNQGTGGVFTNQGDYPYWDQPHYTVGFPPQSISLGGTNHALYLVNWTASGANIQNSTANQTGVEFTSSSATITAKVKGNLISSVSSATSSNSQRKIVRDSNGTYHLVYESAGDIWYTESTDGTNWSAEQLVSDGTGQSSNPSVAVDRNGNVIVAYEETINSNETDAKMRIKTSAGWSTEKFVGSAYGPNFGPPPPLTPVVAAAYSSKADEDFYTFVWCNSGLYVRIYNLQNGVFGSTYSLGTSSSAVVPSITRDYNNNTAATFYVAYKDGDAIYYKPILVSGENSLSMGSAENVSSGDGLSDHQNPVIVCDDNVTTVAYDAYTGVALESRDIVVRQRGFSSWGSFTYFEKADYYIRPSLATYSGTTNLSIAFQNDYGTSSSIYKAEYTSGSWSDFLPATGSGEYPSLSLGNAPGTEKLTYTTGSSSPFAVYLTTESISGAPPAANPLLLSKAGEVNTPRMPDRGSNSSSLNPDFQPTERLIAHFDSGDVIIDFRSLSMQSGTVQQSVQFQNIPDTVGFQSNSQLLNSLRTGDIGLGAGSVAAYRVVSRLKNLTRSQVKTFAVDMVAYDAASGKQMAKWQLLSAGNQSAPVLEDSGTVDMRMLAASNVYLRLNVSDTTGCKLYLGKVYSPGGNSILAKSVQLNGAQTATLVPADFGLFQNYPNPFNPTTTISYGLPKDSYVTLKVYDMLGREVMALVEGNQQAGYHYATFDATSQLPSGVYFYRLTAGKYTSVKKLMLVK